jgi:hypothetical protein
MDLLMKKLKELGGKTEHWKKPKAGEPCSHMHVECWDRNFMCSGCYQEVTDPDRVRSEQEIMKRLGEEDLGKLRCHRH